MPGMSLQSEGGVEDAASPARRAGRPPGSVLARRSRRWLALAALAGLALAGALLAGVSPGGSSVTASGGRVSTAGVAVFRRSLMARLRSQRLDYRSVVCVPNGFRFQGVAVVRCNVDFGDPHIEAYCSVFRGGRLLTSEDDAAIPCGPDTAGNPAIIVQYH
jgi:hypothetical protein